MKRRIAHVLLTVIFGLLMSGSVTLAQENTGIKKLIAKFIGKSYIQKYTGGDNKQSKNPNKIKFETPKIRVYDYIDTKLPIDPPPPPPPDTTTGD